MIKLKRHPSNPILAKNPDNHWEAGSVFNPCVIRDGKLFRMFYRATNDVKRKEKGGYTSSIGYAESSDGLTWKRNNDPILTPSEPYDSDGCEDARVTKINDTYYMHYTAIAIGENDKLSIRIALATSKDCKTWVKHGIVGPAGSTSKAATLFPEKINDEYWWFYTWESDSPRSTIMSVSAKDLEEVARPPSGRLAQTLECFDSWAVFTSPISPDSPNSIGVVRGAEVGAPPLKTEDGWLFIYCNANISGHPEWTVKAALLDLNDPRKVIAKTVEPILAPESGPERNGVVNNVTFPEGAVAVGDELYVYYGSGDQGCCLATCKLSELLDELKAQFV